MGKRPWTGVGVACVIGLAAAVNAQTPPPSPSPPPPCQGAQSTHVFHAYSSCEKDGFWHVLTLEYFQCGSGSIEGRRVNDTPTAQRCAGKGAVPAAKAARGASLVAQVGPADQPKPEGQFVFLECLDGMWYRVHYMRYRAFDGSIKIDPRPVAQESTGQMCRAADPSRAPLPVAGAVGANPPRAGKIGTAVSTPAPSGERTAPTPSPAPAPPAPPPAGSGQTSSSGALSGVVVASRTDGEQHETILLKLPPRAGGRPVDEVRLRVGKDIARDVQPGLLPDGWRAEADGDQLRLSGPALAGDLPIVARLRFPNVTEAVMRGVQKARLELYSDGHRLSRQDVPVERRPPVDLHAPIDDELVLPPAVTVGDMVTLTPLKPGIDGLGGKWLIDSLGGGAVQQNPPPPTTYGYSFDKYDGLRLKVGYDRSVLHGLDLHLRYWDGYGDLTHDVEPPTMTVVEEPPAKGTRVDGCTEKSFQGRIICVCGWFPEEAPRSRLTIDGTPLGEPLTGSSRILYFRLPQEVAPGPHTIALPGAPGSAHIEVLQLGGEIDRDQLMSGQSTPIHIRITGTRDALAIHLVNHTPAIITIQGGEDQIIHTSGGDENVYDGSLRGLSPGDFHLTYELAAGGCPCGEALADTTPAEPDGESWYDDTLARFRRGRKLANDAANAAQDDPDHARELAKAALEELSGARRTLKKGVDSGDIGPETQRTFERFLSEYQSQARVALETPPPEIPITDTTPPPSTPERPEEPVVTTVTDGWFEPSQGVWQDDVKFDDKPGKRLTKAGPALWTAELPMVAGRATALFGIRDDPGAPKYHRIHIEGTTNGTKYVSVHFRFTVVQGGARTVVAEPTWLAQNVTLDGPAGPMHPWQTSIDASYGRPEFKAFTLKPGPYSVEAELVRNDTNQPTGLKVVVSGQAVSTRAPTLHFVPVLLSSGGPSAAPVLGRFARKLSLEVANELPQILPLPPNSLPVTVQPLQELPDVQPGVLGELLNQLHVLPDPDTQRRVSLTARLTTWLATQAALTGGGKVVALLQSDEFKSLWPKDDVGAFTTSQKLIVAKTDARVMTIGHELTHASPFVWSDDQMKGLFGFSYHNEEDKHYASGPRIAPNRKPFANVRSMMGPVGSDWITQGTYWHLLQQFQGAPDPPLVVVRGYLGRQGDRVLGRLGPLYSVNGEPDLAAGTLGAGQVAVVLRDASGAEIARYPFSPGWRIPDLEVDQPVVGFSWSVPDDPSAAEIALVGPGGETLDARRRSANAPTVEITAPTSGAAVTAADGRLHVEWRAADADGDALTFMVLYSPDAGATWRVVSFEQTGTGFDVPVEGRPRAARVKVIATDGGRSGEAEVAFTFAR